MLFPRRALAFASVCRCIDWFYWQLAIVTEVKWDSINRRVGFDRLTSSERAPGPRIRPARAVGKVYFPTDGTLMKNWRHQ